VGGGTLVEVVYGSVPVDAVIFDWYGTLATPNDDDFWNRMPQSLTLRYGYIICVMETTNSASFWTMLDSQGSESDLAAVLCQRKHFCRSRTLSSPYVFQGD
jgi:hypothetical protein